MNAKLAHADVGASQPPKKPRGRPRKAAPEKLVTAGEMLGLGGRVVGAKYLFPKDGRRVLCLSLRYNDDAEGRGADERVSHWPDTPLGGDPVLIALLRGRGTQAGKRRYADLPAAFSPVFGATMRLVQEIVRLGRDHGYRDVDRILKLARGTTQRVATEVWSAVSERYLAEITDLILALDGLKPYSGLFYTNISVPLAGGPLLDVLERHDHQAIVEWLAKADPDRTIAIFVIDPSNMLRGAIVEHNPQAIIIVDKRHMCHWCHRIVEAVRAALGIKKEMVTTGLRSVENVKEALPKSFAELTDCQLHLLIGVFDAYPLLAEAWWVMQDFCRIYEARSRQEAERAFDRWCQSIPPSVFPWFRSLVASLEGGAGRNDWREEFFAYFDFAPRLTTAFVEATNGEIKAHCKRARGQLHFPRMRAECLAHPKHGAITPERLIYLVDAIARGGNPPLPEQGGAHEPVSPHGLRPARRPWPAAA